MVSDCLPCNTDESFTAVKGVAEVYFSCFQGCRGRDDLKSGAGFEIVVDGFISIE